jgi:hypothetical protein
LLGDRILAMHVAEKMYDMLGPGQQRQIPLDDDAVETVIYKNQEACKKLREGFHRSPPQMLGSTPKSSVLAAGGIDHLHLRVPGCLSWGYQGRSPWLYLELDEANEKQNCAPATRTQQYSGNRPTGVTVTAPGRLYALRTIIAQRDSSVFADACRND